MYVQRALGTARDWSVIVQEQHVYGGGLKLYTRCALIRDRQPTARDDFARPAEAEATCIWKVSLQIVVEISKILYYNCQVRSSFCEISEE